jgi:hypothetical protein
MPFSCAIKWVCECAVRSSGSANVPCYQVGLRVCCVRTVGDCRPMLATVTQNQLRRVKMKPSRAILICLVGSVNHANSKIVINEIMIAPSEQSKNRLSNWFELYNTEAIAVRLNDWKFEGCQYDTSGCTRYPLDGANIGPFGYLVLGNEVDPGKNGGVAIDVVLPTYLSFDASRKGPNSVAIFPPKNLADPMPFGTPDDMVSWSDSPQDARMIRYQPSKGVSLAKINPSLSSQTIYNWQSSTAPIGCIFGRDKGTPGKENTFACPLSSSKVVFTEIMIHPTSVTDQETNWFEVYNALPTDVSLNGYRLQLCHGLIFGTIGCVTDACRCISQTIVTDKSIGPYGFLVVGNNNNTLTNGGVTVDIQVTFPAFPNEGKGRNDIYIFAPNTASSDDYVSWSTDFQRNDYLKLPFEFGASLARINPFTTSASLSNWKASRAPINCIEGQDKGTPGLDNTYTCPDLCSGTGDKRALRKASKDPCNERCGLLKLGIICLNGCGILGRLLRICKE